MAKYKFQFDPETLLYKKIRLTYTEMMYKSLPRVAYSIIVGVMFFLGLSAFFKSPVERHEEERKERVLLSLEYLNRKVDKSIKSLEEIQNRDDNIYRQIFQAKPIPRSVRQAGFGGVNRYKRYEGSGYSNKIINTAKRIDILSKQLVVQSKSFDDIVVFVKNKEKMSTCIPAIQPIAIKDLERFGSPYGLRKHPILGYYRMHNGVDLTAKKGTKIYAAGDGRVYRADWGGGYGRCVRINHGYGYETRYAHMSKMLVKEGDYVKRGDVIGEVGSSGLSTGPHLHYEVLINGKFVNPVNFYYNDITEAQYEQMVASKRAETHVFEDDL